MAVIVRDLSKQALVRAVEENLYEFFHLIEQFPRAEYHDEPHALWYVSDIPFPLFNAVTRVCLTDAEAEARIAELVNRARTRRVPLLWWVTPSSRPRNLARRLRAHGFVPAGDLPGMAIDLERLNEKSRLPEGTTIRRVESAEDGADLVRACSAGFGFPDWVRPELGELFDAIAYDGVMENYVAYLHGEPVASSTILYGAGVAGIYNVATVAEARGKGIGAAITLAPLRAARERGYRAAILHASEMGEPVYRRLGFKEYCRVQWWLWRDEQ